MQLSEQWNLRAKTTLNAAKVLYRENCFRDVASRAYYAANQAATAVCIEHGDEVHFSPNWNNPTHDQLPQLVKSNGSLSIENSREVYRLLHDLRKHREDADYRVGLTVDKIVAYSCLRGALEVITYDSRKSQCQFANRFGSIMSTFSNRFGTKCVRFRMLSQIQTTILQLCREQQHQASTFLPMQICKYS